MKTTLPLTGAAELCRLDAKTLTQRYASGELSPVEVAKATLARAEEIQPRCNAFVSLDHEGALAQASESEQRWRRGAPLSPIDGVPTTIKDVLRVKGWVVRYGSHATDPAPCTEDAPSVERLRNNGAVFIGLTTTPEFGWKATTDSLLCGVRRNPWLTDSSPGGSSGGAAAAAASGAGVLHVGSDGAGSIRIPASFCGIVGHKPSFGRVPMNPVSAFTTVAHFGPMARTVGDVALMLRAMEGRDRRDWLQGANHSPTGDLNPGVLSGARIGYWSRPAHGVLSPDVSKVVDSVVGDLAAVGARVEPVDLPGSDLFSILQHHWFAAAANRLSKIPVELRSSMDPGFHTIASIGGNYSGPSLIEAEIRRAAFGAAMDELLETYDFLVSPGTQTAAFVGSHEPPAADDPPRFEWAGFTFPINLSQQPACVVPCGRTPDGFPISLQFIGARGADARVLSAAQDFEWRFPHLHPTHFPVAGNRI